MLSEIERRAQALAEEIDNAKGETSARAAADRLHRLMDDLENVVVVDFNN